MNRDGASLRGPALQSMRRHVLDAIVKSRNLKGTRRVYDRTQIDNDRSAFDMPCMPSVAWNIMDIFIIHKRKND